MSAAATDMPRAPDPAIAERDDGTIPPAAAAAAAQAAFVPVPLPRILAYVATSIFIALTQGFAQGLVPAVLPQIAGQIGATTTEATWLVVAFMVPKTAVPLLLIKIRTQFGLRLFTEVGVSCFVLVSALALFESDLRATVAVQFLSGLSSASLSTLAFLYMLEGLAPALKMRLGLPLALTFLSLGSPLARVVAPPLMGDGSWQVLHLLVLGMALVSLALVFLLPLKPMPRAKVIAPMDVASFALIATALGGLTAVFSMGPTLWWTAVPWLGWTLALSFAAMAIAVVIELHRKVPLIDVHWITSGPILHLAGVLLLLRLILSEQAAGAPRMFMALGLGPDQLTGLFGAIVAASIAGGIACAAVMKPGRESRIHLFALLLIALGAWLDSRSTIDTRPAQMLASQSMIAFAAAMFLPPAMMSGLLQALAKGPAYILSFVIVFLTTQAIGGTLGSGLFTTFINERQAVHLAELANNLPVTSQIVSGQVAALTRGMSGVLTDPLLRQAQAVSQIADEAGAQAFVLAYNDAFLLTALAAAGAAIILVLHMLRDRMAGAAAPAIAPPASSNPPQVTP